MANKDVRRPNKQRQVSTTLQMSRTVIVNVISGTLVFVITRIFLRRWK